jgi:hypothetical protein
VGRVWPRHRHRGRPLNSVVRQHFENVRGYQQHRDQMAIEHGLALLIFIGRAGDILSTQLITPTMILEANPIARRYKWTTFLLGFAFCAVPYFNIGLAVMVAVTFLLVAASNIGRLWMVRALGEREMMDLVLRAAARSSLNGALATVWVSALFFFLAAGILFWLEFDDEIAWYFGVGLALYGLVFAIHSSFFFVRVFRQAREGLRNAA